MKVIKLNEITNELEEKIECLSQARCEALKKYNIRNYVTLSNLVDALNSTRDFIKSLPTIEVSDDCDV